MSNERDIVVRLREYAEAWRDVEPDMSKGLNEAAATIELLRAEVKAWRLAYETWDGNPSPRAFMRRPHEQADATDAAGALGKEASDGLEG